MYEELAYLALFIFAYSLFAGRVERSYLSGPIIFVLAGFLLGPMVMRVFDKPIDRAELRVVADLTLALVLFIDAANADLKTLKTQLQIPSRMLLIGLPGVMLLGFGFAVLLFDELGVFEAAILATMLAATDAALGKAVITNKLVPVRLREALNAESGLNDGLCVPVLFVFIALAEGVSSGSGSAELAVRLVLQELGIGLAVGLALAAVGAYGLRMCWHRGWVTDIWTQVTVVALAFASFAVAQSLHGSGYIAAFCGGMLFGHLMQKNTHHLVHAAESTGETLALVTWVIFGAAVIGQAADHFTWHVIVYALLSLTVVRIVPIFLSLTGTDETVSSKMFLGWFGPRGLASIVFAFIVLNEGLPGAELMSLVVVCTVFFSLVAHGVTANPLARWIGSKEGIKPD